MPVVSSVYDDPLGIPQSMLMKPVRFHILIHKTYMSNAL